MLFLTLEPPLKSSLDLTLVSSGKTSRPCPLPWLDLPPAPPWGGGRGWEGRGGQRDLSYLLWLNWTGPWVILRPLGDAECESNRCVPTQEVFLEEGYLGEDVQDEFMDLGPPRARRASRGQCVEAP